MPGGIENFVHERQSVLIFKRENVAGDFNQVAVQFALIPRREHVAHLVRRHAEQRPHQIVGFANQLHVAVFDAVMRHFDEMPRAVFAHPIAAGRAVFDFGGDGLKNRLDMRPRGRRAARHERRAAQRALFAAGHARADVQQPLAFDEACAADRVREMRIAAVNDDVARLKMRQQLRDEIIHRRPGFDHQHDAARPREALREFRDAAAADETLPLPASVQKFVHFRDSAIIAGDCKPFAFHVQNEVFPHHG